MFYAIAASTDRNVVILNVGDSITIQADPDGTGSIVNATAISTDGTIPEPVAAAPEAETEPATEDVEEETTE